MKSHFQSSETTWISSGGRVETDLSRALGGSSSGAAMQATPPRNRVMSAGMVQVTNSRRPEYCQSGVRRARGLVLRNHHAKAMVQQITGMITASMMVPKHQ